MVDWKQLSLRQKIGQTMVMLPDQKRELELGDGFFQGRVTEEVDESRAVPIEGKTGSAIFMHGMTPHASTTNTSSNARRTLIISYHAADAYPIYRGEETINAGVYEMLVRGAHQLSARITFTEFPIPVVQNKTASLYELQEISRNQG